MFRVFCYSLCELYSALWLFPQEKRLCTAAVGSDNGQVALMA